METSTDAFFAFSNIRIKEVLDNNNKQITDQAMANKRTRRGV